MTNLIESVCNFFAAVGSAIRALIRFFFLVIALIASGIHIILFTRTEICNVEMRGQAWLCDRELMNDKLSFLDKVCLENPELMQMDDEEHPNIIDGGDDGDGYDI